MGQVCWTLCIKKGNFQIAISLINDDKNLNYLYESKSKNKLFAEVKSVQLVCAFLWSKCREGSWWPRKGFFKLDSDLGLVFV